MLHQGFRRAEWQQRFLLAVLASGVIVALIGMAQHLFAPQHLPVDASFYLLRKDIKKIIDMIPQVAAPSATFANKNFAVHLIVPAAALALMFFLRAKKPRHIWGYAACNVLLLVYLFYTGTRAGWLAVGVQIVGWAILLGYVFLRQRKQVCGHWSRHHAASLGAGIAVIVVMIHLTAAGFAPTLKPQWERIRRDVLKIRDFAIGQPQQHRVIDLAPPGLDTEVARNAGSAPAVTGSATPTVAADAQAHTVTSSPYTLPPIELPPNPTVSSEASFAGRLKVWRNTLYMVKDHPLLGVGVGNFSVHFPLYDGRNDGEPMFNDRIQLESAHNDYMNLWAENGTIGLLLALWLAGTVIYVLIRTWLGGEDRVATMGLGLALLGMAINAGVSSPMEKAVPLLVFAVLLSALAHRFAAIREPRRLRLPRGLVLPLAIAASILFVYVAHLQVVRLRADNHYVYMSAGAKADAWALVLDRGHKARLLLPSFGKIYAFLGKASIEQGRYDDAIGYFEKTLAFYPNSPNSLFDMGVAWAKKGGEAREKVDTAVDEAAKKAYDEEFQRCQDKAMEYYRKVYRLLPAYPRLHNNIGAVHMGRGDIDQALREFRIEAELNPDNSKVWFNLGVAYIHGKRFAEAEYTLRRVTRMDPSWALGWKNLGIVLFQFMGRQEEGKVYLRKALEIDPNIEDAERIRQLK